MPFAVEMRFGVQVPMRDGVHLSTDIYLPKTNGPFPTILIRTPYSNHTDPLIARARALANNGYAVALQDTRGRWDSGGDYYPLQGEGVDGYDTQEWIGRQPWSNGKAGMMGAMGAFSALSGVGLGMGEIQGVTKEVVSYGREKAGEDTVNEVVSSIPGLSQFV